MKFNTSSIFEITTQASFQQKALEVFQFQYEHVKVYRQFCDYLSTSPEEVSKITDIPFLPITFFKSKKILANSKKEQQIFTSSGTTGTLTSKHYVADLSLYEQSFITSFEKIYGPIEEYTILALLPSYLEREGSSLIYMAAHFIEKSRDERSGFYLNNYKALIKQINLLEAEGKKTLLLGVSYALLDVIAMQTFTLKHTLVMETGGMKGKRKELVKQELHAILQEGFGTPHIHSEYGMTELLSQGYSTENGIFKTPPWMKVLTRDTEDALTFVTEKTGGINVIDLANLYSCSFIATQDLGRVKGDTFEVLGRFDSSDIRGCNLMVL